MILFDFFFFSFSSVSFLQKVNNDVDVSILYAEYRSTTKKKHKDKKRGKKIRNARKVAKSRNCFDSRCKIAEDWAPFLSGGRYWIPKIMLNTFLMVFITGGTCAEPMLSVFIS